MNSAALGVSRVRNSSANWLCATIFAAIAFLIGCQLAWGGVTGSISGVVRDSSEAVVPAVQMVAHNTLTGIQWTTTTDTQGFYSFQALPVGTYDVEANKDGFKAYRRPRPDGKRCSNGEPLAANGKSGRKCHRDQQRRACGSDQHSDG